MVWTEEEVEYLKNNYPANPSIWELSNKLGKTVKALHRKAQRLKIRREKFTKKPKPKQSQKVINDRHYKKNKQKILDRRRKDRKEFGKYLKNKLGGKCSRCGYSKSFYALDFHHTEGNKEESLSKLIRNQSKQKALKEIKKCILLCANCHRELHHEG